MDLVQVDVVCTQLLQTGLRRPQYLIVTEMRAGYLGGNENAVAYAFDRLACHVLGAVDLGRVYEGRSQFDSPA